MYKKFKLMKEEMCPFSVWLNYEQFAWVRYEVITEKVLYNEKFIDETAINLLMFCLPCRIINIEQDMLLMDLEVKRNKTRFISILQ